MAALLGELHEVGEAVAHAGSLADERGYLIGRRGDRAELLGHGLFDGDSAGHEVGLELIPHARAPVFVDDDVQGVTHGDGAVEIHGEQERGHGR